MKIDIVLRVPNEQQESVVLLISKFALTISEYNVEQNIEYKNKFCIIYMSFDLDENNHEMVSYVIELKEHISEWVLNDDEIEKMEIQKAKKEIKKETREKAKKLQEEYNTIRKLERNRYERKNRIGIRVSDIVFEKLIDMQKETGLNKTDLISKLILYGIIKNIDIDSLLIEMDSFEMQMRLIGNNINQIAYKLNSYQTVTKEDFNKIFDIYKEIKEDISKLNAGVNELCQ